MPTLVPWSPPDPAPGAGALAPPPQQSPPQQSQQQPGQFVRMGKALGRRARRLNALIVRRWLTESGRRPFIVTRSPAIIIAPHPDDETLACGGLIALKRALGVPVRILILTGGGAAGNLPAPLRTSQWTALRRREALAALNRLGVDHSAVEMLDYPDGRLASLGAEDQARLMGRVRGLLSASPSAEIYVTHRRDGHPDHEAAYRLAAAALAGTGARLIEYAIWMPWLRPLLFDLGPQDLAGARRLDISRVRGAKALALAEYGSQLPQFPAGFLDLFRGPFELFFEAR